MLRRSMIAEEIHREVAADKAYQNAMKNSHKAAAKLELERALEKLLEAVDQYFQIPLSSLKIYNSLKPLFISFISSSIYFTQSLSRKNTSFFFLKDPLRSFKPQEPSGQIKNTHLN
jgi:hypothetical protein